MNLLKRTLLLVEDNADDERLTLRALRKLDFEFEVEVARDGAEAIQYLDGRSNLPSLILLDLKLPLLNGLQVLEKIRQNARTSELPVVVLTSSDEPSDVKAAYRLHVNSYVQKPVDFTEFGTVVGRLGEYWLRTNVAPALTV